MDTLAATASGAYVLAENYLYTVEAFHDFLDRLTARGCPLLRHRQLEPRQRRKPPAASSTWLARRCSSAASPIRRVTWHWWTAPSSLPSCWSATKPFQPAEFQRIADGARRLAFLPLLVGDEGMPLYRTLIGPDGAEREALLESLPFDIRAIRDDRPFFFHFNRWRDLIRARDFGPVHGTALGQIVLGILLVSLTLLGSVFIVGPLLVFQRRGRARRGPHRSGGCSATSSRWAWASCSSRSA